MKVAYVTSGVVLAALVLALGGCGGGSSNCGPNEGAQVLLSVNPLEAPADGRNELVALASGQDANCNAFPAGTTFRFVIGNQEPEGVGEFSNGTNMIEVTSNAFGARAEITSIVQGTAVVTAQLTEGVEMLVSLPVQVTFGPPDQTDQCAVELTVATPAIKADGVATTRITALVTGDDGDPMPDGTEVRFTTDKGSFSESGNQTATALTSGGGGEARVTLKSSVLTVTEEAQVTAIFTCDDEDQTEVSGIETVLFIVGDNVPIVDLRANKAQVLADNVSTVALEATVYLPSGLPAPAGTEVSFITDLGRFQESAGTSYDAYTDGSGKAQATYIGGLSGGLATIQASVYVEDLPASDSVQVSVRQLGFIEYADGPTEPLGVKGSGVRESYPLTFIVKDTFGTPFPAGALVEFTKSVAPGVTLDPLQTLTDTNGEAQTTLKSGNTATTVTVTATARVGQATLTATSPAIAIVGAKPNARYLTFSCERRNIGGLSLDFVENKCTVSLADRYTNKIGIATNVTFLTEAGSITPSALTSIQAASLGKAEVTARTGNPRPTNVIPIAGEGYVDIVEMTGTIRHNPRDGLVTLVAITTGEEEFTDVNGNGDYDAGEPFVDLSEPYLDLDDDGIHAASEQFIDANDNSIWDGPNGQWDSSTLIWIPYWVVWTGHTAASQETSFCAGSLPGNLSMFCPHAFYNYGGGCPNGFASIAKGAQVEFSWAVTDVNLNPLNESAAIEVVVTGKGSRGTSSPSLPYNAPDVLGTGINWEKVRDPATLLACQATDPICYMAPAVQGFAAYSGVVQVKGADISNMLPPEMGTVTLRASYQESPGAGANVIDEITLCGEFQ